MFDFKKHYQYIGAQGAAGIGYGALPPWARRWPIASMAA